MIKLKVRITCSLKEKEMSGLKNTLWITEKSLDWKYPVSALITVQYKPCDAQLYTSQTNMVWLKQSAVKPFPAMQRSHLFILYSSESTQVDEPTPKTAWLPKPQTQGRLSTVSRPVPLHTIDCKKALYKVLLVGLCFLCFLQSHAPFWHKATPLLTTLTIHIRALDECKPATNKEVNCYEYRTRPVISVSAWNLYIGMNRIKLHCCCLMLFKLH